MSFNTHDCPLPSHFFLPGWKEWRIWRFKSRAGALLSRGRGSTSSAPSVRLGLQSCWQDRGCVACAAFRVYRKTRETSCAEHRRLENFLRDPIPISFIRHVLGGLLTRMDCPVQAKRVSPNNEAVPFPQTRVEADTSWNNAFGSDGDKRINPSLVSISVSHPREVSTFFQEVPPESVC